ncbi:MAG: pilus assembly protein [Mesorhizobium amorphae]|nr:MAG: pilus assembly protein [Mesorhizobium amorphae]
MCWLSWRDLWRERSGSAAVEFAVVGPLFLLLFFGIAAYGIYFSAGHSVEQIAADAARTAIAGLDETERKQLAARYVERNAYRYTFIAPDRLKVDVADSKSDAQQFEVSVRFDARGLPIWSLLSHVPLPNLDIQRTSTIRIGGV